MLLRKGQLCLAYHISLLVEQLVGQPVQQREVAQQQRRALLAAHEPRTRAQERCQHAREGVRAAAARPEHYPLYVGTHVRPYGFYTIPVDTTKSSIKESLLAIDISMLLAIKYI